MLSPGDACETEEPPLQRQKYQAVHMQSCDRVRSQRNQPPDPLQYCECPTVFCFSVKPCYAVGFDYFGHLSVVSPSCFLHQLAIISMHHANVDMLSSKTLKHLLKNANKLLIY